MEKIWFVLIIIVIVSIALIIVMFKENRKDRKNLFKKLPGDYPEPREIKSEFDIKD